MDHQSGTLLAQSLIPVAAALLGVALGNYLAQRAEQRRWERDRANTTRTFAVSLRCEVEEVFERYLELIGNKIESVNEGEALQESAVLDQNYFIVFDSNADKVGLLETQDAKEVVSFYVAIKGQFDRLRAYEDFLRPNVVATSLGMRRRYTAKLKQQHSILKKNEDRLISTLRKYEA